MCTTRMFTFLLSRSGELFMIWRFGSSMGSCTLLVLLVVPSDDFVYFLYLLVVVDGCISLGWLSRLKSLNLLVAIFWSVHLLLWVPLIISDSFMLSYCNWSKSESGGILLSFHPLTYYMLFLLGRGDFFRYILYCFSCCWALLFCLSTSLAFLDNF